MDSNTDKKQQKVIVPSSSVCDAVETTGDDRVNATIADNYAHFFAAEKCRKSGKQNLDETEFLNVRKYSAAEIEEMIARGQFQQAVHIMAWLLAQRKEK